MKIARDINEASAKDNYSFDQSKINLGEKP